MGQCDTRKFGNETLYADGAYRLSSAAKAHAERVRKKGAPARVIKGKEKGEAYYQVYTTRSNA